jgi:predicted RNA-binding Zn-ribbon protein involved in translation (DUF1610 family)
MMSLFETTAQVCPYCGTELVELDHSLPSGHTHQCPECHTLHAPYGYE